MAAKRKPSKKTPKKTVRSSRSRKVSNSRMTMNQMDQYQMMQPQQTGPSKILVALLVLMVAFSGFLFWKVQKLEKAGGTAQQLDDTQPPRPTELKIEKPSNSDRWRGSKDAKFVLVEYSDLECPFCKSAHPTLQKLLKDNEGKVAWVFRHYPLSFHPKAQKAGEAVECAADQGGDDAFWKMTDAIYEKMPALELSGIPDLATSIGLNGDTLKSCLDSNKFEQRVKDQQAEGTKAGVQATPSTVIYNIETGKNLLVEGAVPETEFAKQLKDFMSK